MTKYYIGGNFSIVGADMHEVGEFNSLQEAENCAREMVIEFASSYGFDQDEDYFGDLDSVGADWDEEGECYEQEGFLEYWVEEYNPEEHDCYLY